MTTPKVVARSPRLETLVERYLPELVLSDESLKTALPSMARDSAESARVAAAVQEVASDHLILRGNARDLSSLGDRSIHLVVPAQHLAVFLDRLSAIGPWCDMVRLHLRQRKVIAADGQHPSCRS